MTIRIAGPFLTEYGPHGVEPGFKGFRCQRLYYVFDTRATYSTATPLALAVEAFVEDGCVLMGGARERIHALELRRMTDWWRMGKTRGFRETHDDRELIAGQGNLETLETMLASVIPAVAPAIFTPLARLRQSYGATPYRACEPVPLEKDLLAVHRLSTRLSMNEAAGFMGPLVTKLAEDFFARKPEMQRNPPRLRIHG